MLVAWIAFAVACAALWRVGRLEGRADQIENNFCKLAEWLAKRERRKQ